MRLALNGYFETTFDAALVPPHDIGDGIGGQPA
jgi:hypothetical protein